nr:MAG TPA: hypothetical protein [Caudoviricetes sp.]
MSQRQTKDKGYYREVLLCRFKLVNHFLLQKGAKYDVFLRNIDHVKNCAS